MQGVKFHEQYRFVLKVQRRSDGGLRIWSDDVPGLVSSGADEAAVLADVRPALEEILSARLGGKVSVAPLSPLPPEIRSGAPIRRTAAKGLTIGAPLGRGNTIEMVAARA